jgi:hypothetical protein
LNPSARPAFAVVAAVVAVQSKRYASSNVDPCADSLILARETSHFAPKTLGEGSNFARNGGDVFADKPTWRFSTLSPHRSRRRLRCPFNALAPQVTAVCLYSTPRPRQRGFRRLADVPLDLVSAGTTRGSCRSISNHAHACRS